MVTRPSQDDDALSPSEEAEVDGAESYDRESHDRPENTRPFTSSNNGTGNENSNLEDGPSANNMAGDSRPSESAQEPPNENLGVEINLLGPSMSQVSLLELMFRTPRPGLNGPRQHSVRQLSAQQSLRPSCGRTAIQLPATLFGFPDGLVERRHVGEAAPRDSASASTDPPNDNNANDVEPLASSFFLHDRPTFERQRMRRRRSYPHSEQQQSPRHHYRPTPSRRNTIPGPTSASAVSLFEFRRRMQLLSILTSAIALSETAGMRSNYNERRPDEEKKSDGDDNK